jgi:hypothetical protein
MIGGNKQEKVFMQNTYEYIKAFVLTIADNLQTVSALSLSHSLTPHFVSRDCPKYSFHSEVRVRFPATRFSKN